MEFVKRGHLGGYVRTDVDFPNGDPMSHCPKVWDWLVGRYNPRTALDVGCGEGHAVRYLRKLGVQAFGIDGCREALDAGVVDKEWLLEHDFTEGPALLPFGRVDFVWCCEFVEHVEERFSENFLKAFDLASVVCMTHALPEQGGHHHVNCRPPDYWIERMAGRDFLLDRGCTEESRRLDQDGYWGRTGLVFIKNKDCKDAEV